MKIADIITAIKPIHIIGQMDKEQDILHLLTDSRELKEKGEGQTSEVLFFALKTAKNDGANYIPELYEKGVRAFVLTNGQWLTANSQWVMDHNDAVFVIVTDVLNALPGPIKTAIVAGGGFVTLFGLLYPVVEQFITKWGVLMSQLGLSSGIFSTASAFLPLICTPSAELPNSSISLACNKPSIRISSGRVSLPF